MDENVEGYPARAGITFDNIVVITDHSFITHMIYCLDRILS
jgi:hypothetical protein